MKLRSLDQSRSVQRPIPTRQVSWLMILIENHDLEPFERATYLLNMNVSISQVKKRLCLKDGMSVSSSSLSYHVSSYTND